MIANLRRLDHLSAIGIDHRHEVVAAAGKQPARGAVVPREDGASHGASFQRAATVMAPASIFTISLLSSRLVKTNPFPSATEDSGPPPSSTVPNTFPSAASITVELALPPLLAKMR